MGKLVVTEFISLDGVFEDPGGAEGFKHGGWTFDFEQGDEGAQFKYAELMAADAQLLGRVTYEGFAKAWPTMEGAGDFGEKMNSMPKYVVSSTLANPEWQNTQVLDGDLAGGVSGLKERYSGDILVAGSGQLVGGLLELELVDELHLMVFPVVLGAGKRLFGETSDKRRLRLGGAEDRRRRHRDPRLPEGLATNGPLAEVEYVRHRIDDADYLVAVTGSGPPVLLLHGFPQTHYCWRRIVPALAARHTLLAPDLRGYGGTSAPAGGPRGEGFTKREMARDLVELMRRLGFERYGVVGHDRGARVAYRLALDEPARVERLAVLNVIPTVDQFERMGAGASLGYWTWLLLAQPAPFPERLIAAAPEHFLRFVFDSWTTDRGAIDEEAFGVYLRALTPDSAAAMCADFRASFWIDRQHDAADREAGRRIECPVLVLTGEDETQLADADDVWRRWARDVRTTTVPGGHFIPEEASEALESALDEFLREPR